MGCFQEGKLVWDPYEFVPDGQEERAQVLYIHEGEGKETRMYKADIQNSIYGENNIARLREEVEAGFFCRKIVVVVGEEAEIWFH